MDTDDAKRVVPSACLEIRLFYVRIAPYAAADSQAPSSLTLTHLRREMGVSLEINGRRVPASDPADVPLRRDRLDPGASEVTYVSTDCVRLTGAVDFEVCDGRGNLILCGSLERLEPPWNNGGDAKTGWKMVCYSAAGSSGFVQRTKGGSTPSIEVYIAGCCSGRALILTQTILVSPRRKSAKPGMLDAIPEDDACTNSDNNNYNQEILVHHRRNSSSVSEEENDEYYADLKVGHSYYPDGWYCDTDDDGQLSWFNAGVRVGVGIGLGMCLGVGIGVGLLMRSYQSTSRSFRKRFI